uniref:VOC family protein n=1 Tax=Siccirubricoccus phaeus TaxID=2595053 RepID=UPI0011F1337D|nr:VOC family protein [Siccirubricoccus phaeus]
MFSHVTIGTHDLARAAAFYDAVLAPLGLRRLALEVPGWAAWEKPGSPARFWVGKPANGLPASWGNGAMTAFIAPSRAAVAAGHAAGLAAGGLDEGAPGLRPHYAPDYYGAYLRDPGGNKLHLVCRDGVAG